MCIRIAEPQDPASMVKRPASLQFLFFASRRRHTRYIGDWSSDVCSSDLIFYSCHPIERAWRGRSKISERVGVQSQSRGVKFRGNEQIRIGSRGVQGLNGQQIRAQIGRASCRERVWISQVHVALKGKENIK